MIMNNFGSKFNNKKVIITGHTGFKGSWLTSWLKLLGAEVLGVSLDIPTMPSHFSAAKIDENILDIRLDIRNFKKLDNIIVDFKPDFVFHLAAQALVKKSYVNPIETWETNVIGTLNVLESLRKLKNECIAIIITSDKCYDNIEWVWGYKETDKLGGPDPYSASKGAAELVFYSYFKSFFSNNYNIKIASARAGNVIGGGDWAENRIIPDCVKAWSENKVVELRNPNSTRPWQHVLEPLSGYLTLAMNLFDNNNFHGESYNFGPPSDNNFTVQRLVDEMSKYWDKVKWKDTSDLYKGPYESGLLKLNCDKALFDLDWKSTLNFDQTVKYTAEWYKNYYNSNKDINFFTEEQIVDFTNIAKTKNICWAFESKI